MAPSRRQRYGPQQPKDGHQGTEAYLPLSCICPNPVNPMPGEDFIEIIRNMPTPQRWAAETLARTGERATGTGELRADHGSGHDKAIADRIATLLHFGVELQDQRIMALIQVAGLDPVNYWIWENSEGCGAEEYMIALLARVASRWHPYVTHSDEVKDFAVNSVRKITAKMQKRLETQVLEGMKAAEQDATRKKKP